MLTTSVAETEMGQLHQKMTDINLTKNCKKAFADQVQKFSLKCKKKNIVKKEIANSTKERKSTHRLLRCFFDSINFFFLLLPLPLTFSSFEDAGRVNFGIKFYFEYVHEKICTYVHVLCWKQKKFREIKLQYHMDSISKKGDFTEFF